ncbi:unnamed protein product [Allacma fusca]|uniref:Uncharacterized protein n=1 Tax=Allacma fusca TaxID=39272 RepID=A0A8J2KYR1_9HEXA|nr:unnamed protein product [Allacma fusca]
MYNAEEGTVLAQCASFTKYCILMGIPFVGWTIVEIFFCVLNNPLIFASVWVILSLVGVIAEYFISSRGVSSTNAIVAQTILDQVGLELPRMSLNLYPDTIERDINNNHNVDIVQVNSGQVRVIPDVGTQTPEIDEPQTPTTVSRPPATSSSTSVRQSSENTIPDVGTQTPEDKLQALTAKFSADPGALPIAESGSEELDLANEFEIQEKILDAATTWIMSPSKPQNNNQQQLRLRKKIFIEDGDPFLEMNSVTNNVHNSIRVIF